VPDVPAWIRGASAAPVAAAYAGEAPAATSSAGASFATMVFAGIAATTLVLWVQGRIREEKEQNEAERLLEETERAQRELDAHREDLAITHDWTTTHPLAVRYGQ
jgi:hypothetical protein